MKIVLTGGPGAGKSSILEAVVSAFAGQVVAVPESATRILKSGFPSWEGDEVILGRQRVIFCYQREMERLYELKYPNHVLICDRGTLDGAAYWTGGQEAFFKDQGLSLEKEYRRYHAILFLEVAAASEFSKNPLSNPVRREQWDEAKRLQDKLQQLWNNHPQFHYVQQAENFDHKIKVVVDHIQRFISP